MLAVLSLLATTELIVLAIRILTILVLYHAAIIVSTAKAFKETG